MEVVMAKPLKVQIIERAKELIQDESRGCRGYLAVDAEGISADPTGSEAVKRCALGALLAAAYHITNSRREILRVSYQRATPIVWKQQGCTRQRLSRPFCNPGTIR